MKVSLNWIKEYLDFELLATDVLVDKIGAQLGAVEGVVDLTEKYKGAVIAKVVNCSPVESSDHLNVCKIDDGGQVSGVERDDNGLVQVVCGAPNVTAGITVVWLPPGTTVPASFGTAEPFVLSARELRGVISNGMLASPKELAIGDSHEGILIVDQPDIAPGADFAKAFGLDDTIIDIENKMFTHRPDCFGQLGVAREIAGILDHEFNSPDWYVGAADFKSGTGLPIEFHNELPSEVPRFTAVSLKNVAIKPSPLWLQSYLSRVGLRPINNVVDITNYIMLLTAQPLHAYDYDKVKALSNGETTLVVRNPHDAEKLELLNGKQILPRAEAIMIATDQRAIGLGGVMGGANTEVDDNTKNLILECATFDMYSIRRTSMAHGIFSDAVTRFNKGQSPLQNRVVLAKAVALLQQLAGAEMASEVIDDNHSADHQPVVKVEVSFINQRLGLELGAEKVCQLLKNVEFETESNGQSVTAYAPFWRTDIELREDIVEEVGRLYGFDCMPLVLPHRDITPAVQDPMLSFKQRIRESLSRAGANEVLSYSFIHGNLLDNVTQKREQAFKLSNALSPELQYYRLHALPSLLDKVHANIKAGYDEFALFELNKGHNLGHKDDDDGVPTEIEFLDFVYASNRPGHGAAFYQARAFLDAVAHDLGLELAYSILTEDPEVPVADPYDFHRSAFVTVKQTGDFLGMVGELKPSVLKKLKLPAQTAVFTVGPSQLYDAQTKIGSHYQPLPRFPKLEQDICLKVTADLQYQELYDFVTTQLTDSKPDNSLLSISAADIYQRPDDLEHRQITFRISLASYDRTLTDAEVNSLLNKLTEAAHQKFGADRI